VYSDNEDLVMNGRWVQDISTVGEDGVHTGNVGNSMNGKGSSLAMQKRKHRAT
jgi:hypothetical protein